MPLTHAGYEEVEDFVSDAEGDGPADGRATVRAAAITKALSATTNAGDFDARAAAKAALLKAI